MAARLRDYNDAINDCIDALSLLYESTGDGAIYNAKVKSTLEKLKDEYEKYPYTGVPWKNKTCSNGEAATECSAPPLGLMPRHIHDEKRITAIKAAIERYSEANKAIPIEWITEYNELIEKLPIEERNFGLFG
jgi:hypothetical protein